MANKAEASTTHSTKPTSELTDLDRRILDVIQTDFPVVREPYQAIAETCGCTADEAEASVRSMFANGDIRRLGAVFDSAHLGYVSTLCAMAVPGDQDAIERAAAVVSAYPGVTHNYQRDDRYNVWFTVTALGQDRIDKMLAEIIDATGVDDIIDLPAKRLFKIRVDFKMSGDGQGDGKDAAAADGTEMGGADSATKANGAKTEGTTEPVASVESAGPAASAESAVSSEPAASQLADVPNPRDIAARAPELDGAERALVRLLQDSIPEGPRPFDTIADQLARQGLDLQVEDDAGKRLTGADAVIARIRAWLADGTIRRFGAIVRHRKLGFKANAMTVWNIPDDQAVQAGAIMAADPHVSHCYERPRTDTWPSNLYAMMHGTSRDACVQYARELWERLVAAGVAAPVPRLLFSAREFKKCSMRYFCEDE
jgi:DNA-binding Lrp family transcriptional regulator